MLQDADARELDALIEQSPELIVMFYGKSCPYSRNLFPHFRDAKIPAGVDAVRAIIAEDDDVAWDKYTLEVTPTIAFFRGGREAHRIEGIDNRGLDPHEWRRYMNKIAIHHAHVAERTA